MKKVLLIALTALPLVACVEPVDEDEGRDEGDVTSSEQALLGADLHVDFDQVFAVPDLPFLGSTPVADGTAVDKIYAGYGVAFSCLGAYCRNGNAFARSTSSRSNVVSIFGAGFPAFDIRYGELRAEFATARNWVSIDATPIPPAEYRGNPEAKPYIQAYDDKDQPIGTAVKYPWPYGHANWGRPEPLTVAAKGSIKSVRFSSEYYGGSAAVYGEFDNLRFNGDRPTVYEPPPGPIELGPVLP